MTNNPGTRISNSRVMQFTVSVGVGVLIIIMQTVCLFNVLKLLIYNAFSLYDQFSRPWGPSHVPKGHGIHNFKGSLTNHVNSLLLDAQ